MAVAAAEAAGREATEEAANESDATGIGMPAASTVTRRSGRGGRGLGARGGRGTGRATLPAAGPRLRHLSGSQESASHALLRSRWPTPTSSTPAAQSPPLAARPRASCASKGRSRTSRCRVVISAPATPALSRCRHARTAASRCRCGCWLDLCELCELCDTSVRRLSVFCDRHPLPMSLRAPRLPGAQTGVYRYLLAHIIVVAFRTNDAVQT